MDIRPEAESDRETIFRLTKEAFAPMPFSAGDEAEAIDRLRADNDLTLSLVAAEDSEILGHIAFSPAFLDEKHDGWFALGPVSVWPRIQRRGVGAALIQHGLADFSARGARGILLIGDPAYYRRFGFVGDGRIGYRGLAPEIVQWRAFGAEKPAGQVRFSAGLE